MYFKNSNKILFIVSICKHKDKTFMKLLLNSFRDLKEKNNFYFKKRAYTHSALVIGFSYMTNWSKLNTLVETEFWIHKLAIIICNSPEKKMSVFFLFIDLWIKSAWFIVWENSSSFLSWQLYTYFIIRDNIKIWYKHNEERWNLARFNHCLLLSVLLAIKFQFGDDFIGRKLWSEKNYARFHCINSILSDQISNQILHFSRVHNFCKILVRMYLHKNFP